METILLECLLPCSLAIYAAPRTKRRFDGPPGATLSQLPQRPAGPRKSDQTYPEGTPVSMSPCSDAMTCRTEFDDRAKGTCRADCRSLGSI